MENRRRVAGGLGLGFLPGSLELYDSILLCSDAHSASNLQTHSLSIRSSFHDSPLTFNKLWKERCRNIHFILFLIDLHI